MAATPQKPELITIVGPTASGKSELAMKIAEQFGGEIIAADSRTVYKGMDIGTAKPPRSDQKRVKHWGLDLVEPGERFTVHQFQRYAKRAITDVQKHGKLPILVGGTGLYIDAVLFDFEFRSDFDPKQRQKLESLTTEQLQKIIEGRGYPMPENAKNKRHLVRTIETAGKKAKKGSKQLKNVLLVGILPSAEILIGQIDRRVDSVFGKLVKETRELLEKYDEEALLSSAGIAYSASLQMINRHISEQQAKKLIKTKEWQYARRQRTWFKRNKFIQWFENPELAYEYIAATLNK